MATAMDRRRCFLTGYLCEDQNASVQCVEHVGLGRSEEVILSSAGASQQKRMGLHGSVGRLAEARLSESRPEFVPLFSLTM